MTGRKKDPLRALTEEERKWLERISRSQSEPASHVTRAKEILAVADGYSYSEDVISDPSTMTPERWVESKPGRSHLL